MSREPGCRQTRSFGPVCGQALVEGRTTVSGEVVQHYSDLLCLWVVLLNQAPHPMSELPFPSTLGDRQIPPACERLEAHENPAHPSPLVLRVEALDVARLHR